MNMYYVYVIVKVFLNLECLGFFLYFFKFYILFFDNIYKYCNIYGFVVYIYVVVNMLMKNIWILFKYYILRV